jgi:hypothetical protein
VPSFPKDIMSIRLIGALLGGAAFMLATAVAAQNVIHNIPGGGRDSGGRHPAGTTVKNGKSNTSARMGGGGGGRVNDPPRGVGSGGRKGATCCSSLIPNAAGTDCVCR